MEPWEALDVDDTDLSAFLRPCNANSSSSALIPGPAGAVQAVMSNRSCDEPLPTQEFIRRVGCESHRDFSTNAWLCAIQFVRSQGIVDADDVAHGTPLNSIKNTERVPLVVAVIKSCTPNGLGDMKITLKVLTLLLLTATKYIHIQLFSSAFREKIHTNFPFQDPTTTVSASVHRKVFAQPEFKKNIAVGSVLVLQEVFLLATVFSGLSHTFALLSFNFIMLFQVAVFCPNRSTCYLNITVRNVLQVCRRLVSVFHFRLIPIC